MKVIVINSKEKYRWISVILNFIWAILLLSIIIDYFLNYEILKGVLVLLISLIVLSFFEIKFITKITDFKIEQGYKVGFMPKLFKSRAINKSDFKGIEIIQDGDKYFQILATDTNGNSIILDRIPNLNPSKTEVTRIESLLSQKWNMVIPFSG